MKKKLYLKPETGEVIVSYQFMLAASQKVIDVVNENGEVEEEDNPENLL